MTYAPIVLFVYNRPWHTEQTLRALMKNDLAKESELFIYADGPKEDATEEQLNLINQVRILIRQEQWCGQVNIIESQHNKGLADSIISGVTRQRAPSCIATYFALSEIWRKPLIAEL